MNYFLEGKDIYLRGFTRSDIPVWYDWFNDSLITAHMNKGFFPNSEASQEQFFDSLLKSQNDLQLAIVLKENDLLIGIVGIHDINWVHRHGDVSIVIGDKTRWGQGIATEAISLVVKHAFTKMNLRKLTAGMSALNIGTRKCFEKNDFILEGTRRKHFFYKGAYVDICLYGFLREEAGF